MNIFNKIVFAFFIISLVWTATVSISYLRVNRVATSYDLSGQYKGTSKIIIGNIEYWTPIYILKYKENKSCAVTMHSEAFYNPYIGIYQSILDKYSEIDDSKSTVYECVRPTFTTKDLKLWLLPPGIILILSILIGFISMCMRCCCNNNKNKNINSHDAPYTNQYIANNSDILNNNNLNERLCSQV